MLNLVTAVRLSLSLLLCAVGPAMAAQTPEQVANAYLESTRTNGMASAYAFIHPEELTRFRAMILPLVEGNSSGSTELRAALFGRGVSSQSVSSLSAEEFSIRLLASIEVLMDSAKVRLQGWEILGSVKEGAVVHLVVRSKAGAGAVDLTQVMVVSLRPFQDSWRLQLSGEMEGVARALKAQLEAASR